MTMRWIIESSLRLRFLVLILAATLFVFGTIQLRRMPVDVFPEFDPPLVEVQTEALGLSAAETESLITVPLEADLLNGVAWLDQIYSESVAGLSSIILLFEPGTDPIRARQMVQERLTQTFALPNVSKPPTMLQPLSTSRRVMMVGLSSDNLSLIELGVLARWNIKPRLMGVPGVANVAIWGQRERQLQVQVDPKRLRAAGVTLSQIIKSTGEALWFSPLPYLESSSPGTAGWIDTPNQRLTIRHQLPISSPQDLARVVIAGGRGLALGDVAQVVEDHQPLIGDAVLGDGSGLLLVIEKFPSANTLAVTRAVEDSLEAMRPGLTGIKIDTTIFRPANYLEQAMGNLTRSLLLSAALMIVVLGAFFGQWRPAFTSFVTIPLSLIAAAVVLFLRGATFNMMTLAGLMIALGVVVDDAIIDGNTLVRATKRRIEPTHSILESTLRMRTPTAYATLIIVLTVLPVFFLQGLPGAFFQPLVVSYILSVVTSMMVALTVTPALNLAFLAYAPMMRLDNSPFLQWLKRRYQRILTQTLRTPRRVFVTVGILIFVSIALLPTLGYSLLPSFKQTDLLIEWEAAPGTSRTEMNRITTTVSRELGSIAGVKNVGAHVGRAVTGDAVVGINSGELWVSLDPRADYNTTRAAIDDVVAGYPGLFREVQTYQPKRISEALMENDNELVLRIYGHDFGVLKTLAQELRQIVSEISGVVEARADLPLEEPQVEIEVDLAKALQYRVIPGEVRRQAATLLSGLQVGNLYEAQKVFDVVVWGTAEIRGSLTDIGQLLIETPGGQVPLKALARVRIVPAPVVIKRDVVSRFIDIDVNVGGRGAHSIKTEINRRLEVFKFPLEYHAEALGVSGQKQANWQRMLSVAVVALIGIFLLLQAAFGSWRLAAVTFFALPIALTGGVLAVLVGGSISLGSIVGLLTILAIAVRNGIVLINHFQNLETQEGETFGPQLVLRGSRERLAPILMTAATLGLALVPMVVTGNSAGNEIVHPIAIVILGGLVTSTIVNLIIVPVLYLRFGSSIRP